ncbi:MAG: AMP-binding protein [Bacteroidales bacterium]
MNYKENQLFLTLPAIIRQTAKEKGANPAFSTVGSDDHITYGEAVKRIDSIIYFLEQHGIQPGDKVAILSANMPNWSLVYFAITSMGAVAIPLLPDFSDYELENILTHSEAKAIFVSKNHAGKLPHLHAPDLDLWFGLEDFSTLNNPSAPSITWGEQAGQNYVVQEEDLAVIIYTSGTTGNSKGVMLSHKNIVFNAWQSGLVQSISENDRFLSILPLSHTYENTIGLILPVMYGAHIFYLSKPPSPAIMLPALKKVRPTIMLTVPLIIEKIYKSKILPVITKNKFTRHIYAVGFLRKGLNLLVGRKLKKTFGGKLKFFGIGGAKLNGVVEQFLIDAKFPYAIGYGLTETSPLAAGLNPSTVRWQSTGPSIRDGQIKIHKPDPVSREGEIWVKGPHVMQGYYKNPEKTREVMSDDGWFKTGDLGIIDQDGFLYIKGRLKNLIVGSSGENIYPEEIEAIINNFNHVLESVVFQEKGKLVALVYFNHEELKEKYQHLKEGIESYIEARKSELRQELLKYVNSRVNKFSKLQLITVHQEPFKKTATHKIKRFLYTG